MFSVFRSSGIEGNYSISSNPLLVSDDVWTIYPAKHRTTNKKASVWRFNKKEYETRLTRQGTITRSNRNLVLGDIYGNLKKYISNLSKIKHPNFLTVIEPLEEHKNKLVFVTEYVVNDLVTLEKSEMSEIVVTKGLLQVANGLKFLHQKLSTVHLNINPSSILVTENSDWKISGLQFIEKLENGTSIEKYVDPLDSRMPSFLSIDFRFSSPVLLLQHRVEFADDLFSLGCLIFYLFNDGESAIECDNSSLLDYERSFNKLQHKINEVKETQNFNHPYFEEIPESYKRFLFELFEKTLNQNGGDVIQLEKPFTIDDLINSSIFNSELIKLLNVMDTFDALQNQERISALTRLSKEINQFPKALIIDKFIPILSDAVAPYLKNSNKKKLIDEEEQIVQLSLENLILSSKSLSQLTFTDKVYPVLKACLDHFNLDQINILFISHLDIIRTKLGVTAPGEFGGSKHYQNFLSFAEKLFDKSITSSSSVKLQETLLTKFKDFLIYEPYSGITNKFLPAICDLFSTTTSLRVKVLTAESLVMMVNGVSGKSLDNYVIVERVLPLIHKTQVSNLKNGELLSCMVSLYESIFKKMSGSDGQISINGKELSVSTVIMESVYFELWKITDYISNSTELTHTFNALGMIENYLKRNCEKKVHASTPTHETTNGLRPTKVVRPKSNQAKPVPDFDTLFKQGTRKQPPVVKAKPLILGKKNTVNDLHFGASSPNSNSPFFQPLKTSNTHQPIKPVSSSGKLSSYMMPMKATKTSLGNLGKKNNAQANWDSFNTNGGSLI